MSFDSALSHRDSRATSGASAATASGGADSTNIMAKKNKPTSTETPATAPVVNTPQTPLGKLQAAVRAAERAFLTAVDQGGDGASERETLKAAKAELAAFTANRVPIAARALFDALSANGDDLSSKDVQAAVTEMRSALSGIAKPATPSAPAATE